MTYTLIQTSNHHLCSQTLKQLEISKKISHKGDNGKVLIIGGSTLFHAPPIWSAETVSHFADMVHLSSTSENIQLIHDMKVSFRNGIVIPHAKIEEYLKEDDVILIGPGMVRGAINKDIQVNDFGEVLKINDESMFTRVLTQYVLTKYPMKRFVLDAGALQMMDNEWLINMQYKVVITPHIEEFHTLFGIDLSDISIDGKVNIIEKTAQKYNVVILLKAVSDVISDGEKTYVVEGGNQGLTKGGTGDILAGLTASFYAKNNPVLSAISASIVIKSTADELFLSQGYWYNNDDVLHKLSAILKKIVYNE
ncbi:MAG: NAD(P)H-hydrate dehydratase [Candidatus Roizmanbacteria bacterium]